MKLKLKRWALRCIWSDWRHWIRFTKFIHFISKLRYWRLLVIIYQGGQSTWPFGECSHFFRCEILRFKVRNSTFLKFYLTDFNETKWIARRNMCLIHIPRALSRHICSFCKHTLVLWFSLGKFMGSFTPLPEIHDFYRFCANFTHECYLWPIICVCSCQCVVQMFWKLFHLRK